MIYDKVELAKKHFIELVKNVSILNPSQKYITYNEIGEIQNRVIYIHSLSAEEAKVFLNQKAPI